MRLTTVQRHANCCGASTAVVPDFTPAWFAFCDYIFLWGSTLVNAHRNTMTVIQDSKLFKKTALTTLSSGFDSKCVWRMCCQPSASVRTASLTGHRNALPQKFREITNPTPLSLRHSDVCHYFFVFSNKISHFVDSWCRAFCVCSNLKDFYYCVNWRNMWSRSSSAHHLFIAMDFPSCGSLLTEQMLSSISGCLDLKRSWTSWCKINSLSMSILHCQILAWGAFN